MPIDPAKYWNLSAGFDRWTPAQKKRDIERIVGEVIEAIEQEGREPDLWERFHLAQAINLVGLGWNDIAHVNARFATIPRDQISPQAQIPALPELNLVTLFWLKQQLNTLKHQPLKIHGRLADPD